MEYTVKLTRDQIEIAIKACRTYARVPLVPNKSTLDARALAGRLRVVQEEQARNYDRSVK